MFCYRKNDLDMMISSWNYNKTVCLKTSPIEIEPEKNFSTSKSIKFLGSGVKARVGRVSGNNKFFRPNNNNNNNNA